MMGLLREIDELAKLEEFRLFLEDIKSLEPVDMNENSIIQAVNEWLEPLIEGPDFDAHAGLARAAGHTAHVANSRVADKLAPKKTLGLQRRPGDPVQFKSGQEIKAGKKAYEIVDALPDGSITVVPAGSKGMFGGYDSEPIKIADAESKLVRGTGPNGEVSYTLRKAGREEQHARASGGMMRR